MRGLSCSGPSIRAKIMQITLHSHPSSCLLPARPPSALSVHCLSGCCCCQLSVAISPPPPSGMLAKWKWKRNWPTTAAADKKEWGRKTSERRLNGVRRMGWRAARRRDKKESSDFLNMQNLACMPAIDKSWCKNGGMCFYFKSKSKKKYFCWLTAQENGNCRDYSCVIGLSSTGRGAT